MSFRFSDLMREALICLSKAWMASTGEGETQTSKRFTGDASFFKRLPHNRPTARTTDPIIQRFSDEWPVDAPWPVSFPQRPPQGKWDDLTAEIEKPGGKSRPRSKE